MWNPKFVWAKSSIYPVSWAFRRPTLSWSVDAPLGAPKTRWQSTLETSQRCHSWVDRENAYILQEHNQGC